MLIEINNETYFKLSYETWIYNSLSNSNHFSYISLLTIYCNKKYL